MSKYEVKSVVCDYGVFEDNELKLICNSHANALKIKEILETDNDMSKPYVWQDQKIADLEAKLEQYEKFMRDNEWNSIEEMQKTLNECEKKYFDMQHQLAEKEKAFNWLHEKYAKYVIKAEKEIEQMQDKLHHYYEETLNNGTCGLCEHLRGEYKTDFAIEQIVKTKETLIKFLQDEGFYENEWYDLFDKIDNQIKELKEGK